MEVLRIGSRGENVLTLQKLLKQKGYSISVDGIFGSGTEDVVEQFQEDNNLGADGVVGRNTWHALTRVDATIDKRIDDTSYALDNTYFYGDLHLKKNIVLHHTNGWVVRKGVPSMNHINWWKSQYGAKNNKACVATAYSIDYAGNIYQHFDPAYWAYHLGLGSSRNYLDKSSVGIELTNEGFLEKKDEKFYWYSGKVAIPYNRPNDEPVYLKNGWRDYNYYAPYSKEQIESSLWLVKYLINKFDIENDIIDDFDYHSELLNGTYKGIYSHCNVRNYPSKYPKWDISPAFPIQEFKDRLEG